MRENGKYVPQFHLMPPGGWLNDPNGLCQLGGVHHIFFQYTPDDPRGGDKYWGHYETKDYVQYRYTGIFLRPDCRADQNGVFSGSAYVENNEMFLYYTGNVEKDGEYDYVYSGREGNTILVTSADGIHASTKEWLLHDEDYPDTLSNHVRDPKVFCENGIYYMVLGARTKKDEGCVMLYTSDDKRNWKFDHFIRKADFGYMWECPDLFRLGEEQYLSLSPQGLQSEEFRYQNIYQSGYFRATADLIKNGDGLGDFTEWDYGFDFYAPQTYADEAGRRILIGWMGVPDAVYDHDPTIAQGWQHMLTIPRELSVCQKTKRILQNPIREMEALRKEEICSADGISLSDPIRLPGCYEMLLSGFGNEDFRIIFDEGFVLSYDVGNQVLCFRFTKETLGYGRTERKIRLLPKERITDMRILADTCCMEIYINGGAYVFTTKLFPAPDKERTVQLSQGTSKVSVYALSGVAIEKVSCT